MGSWRVPQCVLEDICPRNQVALAWRLAEATYGGIREFRRHYSVGQTSYREPHALDQRVVSPQASVLQQTHLDPSIKPAPQICPICNAAAHLASNGEGVISVTKFVECLKCKAIEMVVSSAERRVNFPFQHCDRLNGHRRLPWKGAIAFAACVCSE